GSAPVTHAEAALPVSAAPATAGRQDARGSLGVGARRSPAGDLRGACGGTPAKKLCEAALLRGGSGLSDTGAHRATGGALSVLPVVAADRQLSPAPADDGVRPRQRSCRDCRGMRLSSAAD